MFLVNVLYFGAKFGSNKRIVAIIYKDLLRIKAARNIPICRAH